MKPFIMEDLPHQPDSIFISYRRSDSAEVAGRIYDWLTREFPSGAVFKDVDSIPFGVDFREHLKGVLGKCRVVLVLIGPTWSSVTDSKGDKRLDNAADLVRVEVETSMANENIRVIPVLVGGAKMPASSDLPESLAKLRFLNAADVRRDPDFKHDMERLIRHLKVALQAMSPIQSAADPLNLDVQTRGITFRASPDADAPADAPIQAGDMDLSAPPQMPQIELRFHRHCIAGMRGVFQLKMRNMDRRQLGGAKLKLVSSSWKDGGIEIDLFGLQALEEAIDTYVVTFADAGPGTIQSCTLHLPGPWGTLTAQGRWPSEFPVLSFEAAMQAANRGAVGGSSADADRLNDYLLKDIPAPFVPVRFAPPQVALEALADSFRDNLLSMEFKKVQISREDAVWFAQYPVRQKDWSRLMTGSLALQRARANRDLADGEQSNCPMHYVDMDEALEFCRVLNEQATTTGIARPGYHYRLATVMEWQIACGFETLTDSELNGEAWHGGRGLISCQPVGKLSPNKHGLHDMRGNVFEWCLPDEAKGRDGCIAGGSWFDNPSDRQACRSGKPGPCPPNTRSSRIGFRVVLARHRSDKANA